MFDLKPQSECDREEKVIENWNIFEGGGVGASIGFAVCLLVAFSGINLSGPEIFTIVGGLTILGGITGYVMS
jgi:hypothetical protein